MCSDQAEHHGSCLCGAVRYALASRPRATTHCHCTMCRKQHGAAFATYASVPRADLRYLAGEALLTAYRSSAGVVRRFCSQCGANIEWSGSAAHPDWVSITVATLDTPFVPGAIRQVHLDAKVCWLGGV